MYFAIYICLTIYMYIKHFIFKWVTHSSHFMLSKSLVLISDNEKTLPFHLFITCWPILLWIYAAINFYRLILSFNRTFEQDSLATNEVLMVFTPESRAKHRCRSVFQKTPTPESHFAVGVSLHFSIGRFHG